MTKTVHVVDYGAGNLFSVARAVEHVGGDAKMVTSPDEILSADRLILPGVGAFEPCIQNLRNAGLVEPIIEFARSGRPFLGICVGMQMLFDYSHEFGLHQGLGLIGGHVREIPNNDVNGSRKVPHIGWAALDLPQSCNSWDESILQDLLPGHSSAYFVHSYSCVPSEQRHWLAKVDYAGYDICAAVQSDNVLGFQCHPEKSAAAGLTILRNFLML